MGTESPNDLLKLWKLEKMSVEMAIGHILQNLAKQQEAIEVNSLALYHLQADVEGLIAHTGIESRSRARHRLKGKTGPSKK